MIVCEDKLQVILVHFFILGFECEWCLEDVCLFFAVVLSVRSAAGCEFTVFVVRLCVRARNNQNTSTQG